jgi:hypothetical protein
VGDPGHGRRLLRPQAAGPLRSDGAAGPSRRAPFPALAPVALLAALTALQTFGHGAHGLVLDARAAGLAAAGVAVWRRAPFLLVVVVAVVVTALVRALGHV